MSLKTSSSSTAWATATCTDCGRLFGAYVELTEGNNHAYVKCAGCGHINTADSFDSPKSA